MVGRQQEEDTNVAGENKLCNAPSQCASRGRAEDLEESMKEMVTLLQTMDASVIQRMVQAQNASMNIKEAFPNGDERFNDESDESNDNLEEYEDEGDVGEEQTCVGLLDDDMDVSPQECLRRAKEQYHFDIVSEMEEANLDFLERIRLVNMIRRAVQDGVAPNDLIAETRNVIRSKSADILGNDAYLTPTIPEDLLLTALEVDDGDIANEDNLGPSGDEENIASAAQTAVEDVLRRKKVLE